MDSECTLAPSVDGWLVVDTGAIVLGRLAVASDGADQRRGRSDRVEHTLKPGWMWTYAYTDLIEEGKRLRQAIDNASPS